MNDTKELAVYTAPVLIEKINMVGITTTESDEINKKYSPYLSQVQDVSLLSQKINFENPGELDVKIARDLRLRLVKIRTSCETEKKERKRIHQLKADIEQLAFNIVSTDCKNLEEKFSNVEKATEIKMKQEKEALKVARTAALNAYDFNAGSVKVEDLSEEAFNLLVAGLRQKQEDAERAAAKVQEEAIKKQESEKRRAKRIEEIINFGAKINDGTIILNSKNAEFSSATVTADELEVVNETLYSSILISFCDVAKINEIFEKTLQQENEKLLSEKKQQQEKQNRYNARVRALSVLGGTFKDEALLIIDITNDSIHQVHFDEIMNCDDVAFHNFEKNFSIAHHNNQHQLNESKKEVDRQESIKQRAAAAKEKRYGQRSALLMEVGARISENAFELKNILNDQHVTIPVDALKNQDEVDFSDTLNSFKELFLENTRQLAIHAQAEKTKAIEEAKAKEDEQQKIQELEQLRKAALAPDKEKLMHFADALKNLPRPVLKSNEAVNILKNIDALITKTVNYLTEKSNQI